MDDMFSPYDDKNGVQVLDVLSEIIKQGFGKDG
jgi:hypothetical protein